MLAAGPIRRVLQAHLAVARVAGAATHVDADLAAGQDDRGAVFPGFSSVILDEVASAVRKRRSAPAERALARAQAPALACIIGAFRPCTAPMISLRMMELFETVVPLAKARRTTRKDLPKPLDLALFARPLAAKISGASAS